MKKNKIVLFATILALVAVLCFTLCGCAVTLEDCIVFGEEEFAGLKLEDNSISDGDLRVMSANVLVHIAGWGGEPVKPRAQRFAEAVKHYAPDVIGMQEMCKDWYKYLPVQLSDYEVIEPKNSAFMENKSAILYNKTKLTLLEHGLKKYSKGDKNGCRAVTYGVFKRNTDNKQFIVTSTHFDLIRNKDYEAEKKTMLIQVAEFKELINSLKSKYPNTPIIMTGDYNSMEHENSRFTGDVYDRTNDLTYFKCYGKAAGAFAYQEIIKSFIDTKFMAGVKQITSNTKGYKYDDPTWDHIFITNEAFAEVKTFRVLDSDYFLPNADGTKRISDHLPICVDFAVK